MSQYTLVLDVPDRVGSVRVEPAQRLKQALKLLGRALGIRCVSVAEVKTGAVPEVEQPSVIQTQAKGRRNVIPLFRDDEGSDQ